MKRILQILRDTVNRKKELEDFTDEELAEKLLEDVWSDENLFSEKADLIEEAIERLRKKK